MRHGIKIAAMLAAVTLLLGLAACTPPTAQQRQAALLAADAQSGFVIVGTLSTLGSFEWDIAPLRTHLGLVTKEAGAAYLKHEITQDQASTIYEDALHARALLDQAAAACRQSDHTGHCTGNEGAARALLEQAKAAIAAIPYTVH